MFCINCGQQLPERSKFCSKCGTPQGLVSPISSTNTESDNTNDVSTFRPAMCPNCNAHMKVDPSCMLARCDACGTECLVQDAIKALSSVTVKQDIQVGNATFNVSGTNTDALLKRVEIMLADGDFIGAMSKCDTLLDSDPTNGKVYYFMLMSDLKCKTRNSLASQAKPYDGNQYYIKAMQFGDETLKSELQGYTNNIYSKYDANLKNPRSGAEICFGHYNNGQRIIWKILRIQNNMIFIICSDNICTMPYHNPGGRATWSDCTLRKWLNSDFINGFFSQAEITKILPCELNNDNNPEFNTPGGVSTIDKVFLLSRNEAYNTGLFDNDQARANGALWWLRSPGSSSLYAAYVNPDGTVESSGHGIILNNYGLDYNRGVRPAMWIKLDP